ncbi:MAG TPA: iron-sulfur cluster assembly scaffold protein [Pyrinomonadaceae bacterium]|jgi:NifU-like protein
MPYYPEQVLKHFLYPRNAGEVDQSEASGEAGSLKCGAVLRLSLKIDSESRKLLDARFKATGCGYLIAAASVLTELLKDLTVGEAAKLSESSLAERAIAERLGEVPPEKAHCLALCREALAAANRHYRTSTLEEWTGDEALVCTCFGISEKTIEHVIRAGSLVLLEEVTRACNAGAGCRSCHPLIEDILADYRRTFSANPQ